VARRNCGEVTSDKNDARGDVITLRIQNDLKSKEKVDNSFTM